VKQIVKEKLAPKIAVFNPESPVNVFEKKQIIKQKTQKILAKIEAKTESVEIAAKKDIIDNRTIYEKAL